MQNLLIGSRALAYWNKNLQISSNADWDIISDKPIEGAEWHDSKFLNNAEFEQFTNSSDVIEFNNNKVSVVNIFGLSIIKRSHLWRSLSFQKHITHYHKYLTNFKRKQYNSYMEQILQERILLTMQAYPQAYPRLNKRVDEFFDDYVTKKYNHDYLHELVAYYDKPLYTRMQHNPDRAWCDKDLWNDLALEDKTKCIAEEVQVIAIERFMVPNDWKYSVRLAYIKSLDKVCTTLCSGWFRDHAIDYYPEVLALCDTLRIAKIRKELELQYTYLI
jgi:hypothetical protein